jgi:hypothetical protein
MSNRRTRAYVPTWFARILKDTPIDNFKYQQKLEVCQMVNAKIAV